MKIIQLVSNLNYGDAIGNDIIAKDRMLRQAGYETTIMALAVHPRLQELAKEVDIKSISPDDMVIFHKASGDALTDLFLKMNCHKVLLYHNITPAEFFIHYDLLMAVNLMRGRKQLKQMAGQIKTAWGDSEYNCDELRRLGFRRVRKLPIYVEFDRAPADPVRLEELKREAGRKFLFVGRIAPNKKQEDVIKAVATYQQMFDESAKLYLIGSHAQGDKYYAKVRGFTDDTDVKNVIYPGHVTDEEKNAYFEAADAFICMSEHEGFCVPLLEAMHRQIPVVAYRCAAVPETLGENGLLVDQKNYREIALMIHSVVEDAEKRKAVIQHQNAKLKEYTLEAVQERFLELIDEALRDDGQTNMDNRPDFKPLWKIHNPTYRQLRKGTFKKRVRHYAGRIYRTIVPKTKK